MVSAINEFGYIYLQLNTNILTSLKKILPSDEIINRRELFLKSKEDIDKNQVYLIKCNKYELCRVQVLEIVNNFQVSY